MKGERIEDIIQGFEPISLAEMDGVKLMNRIDTKYVVPLSLLPAILEAAQSDYFAQEIEGRRIAVYDTVYYDTEDLDMYIRHHDRQLARQKIRVRQYVNTNETFLEVKRKNNKGRTSKRRMVVRGFDIDADTIGHGKKHDRTVAEFIALKSRYQWAELTPHLRTQFRRITLVNKARTERLTIDMNLVWENMLSGERRTFPQMVIVELKRDGNVPSRMTRIMIANRVKPLKISKYCIGTALTTPGLKTNRFKDKIRRIEKLLADS